MPDFGRWGSNGGDPSLNAIARTDRFLDALASEQPAYAADPGDAALANLLAGWRDEAREPPATGLVSQRDAVAALESAVSSRRRTRAAMAVVGSVAAALLCLGGFGAVVYGAGPGDALYGLHTMLFGEQQATRNDQVALAAQTQLNEVQQLVDQGQWSAAQDKLAAVSSTVQTVDNGARKQELLDQINRLSVKVEKRDPNATLPPVVVAPPAGAPVPAIVGPTSSSETTTSSSGTTSSSQPSTSSSTSSSSTSSSSTSSSDTSSSSTSSSSTSSSTSTTPSSPVLQPPPTTTTTSTSPPPTTTTTTTTTTTPPTTTPAPAVTTTTASTSAPSAPAVVGGSSVAAPPPLSASSPAPGPHGQQGQQSQQVQETPRFPVATTTIVPLPQPGVH